MKIVYTDGSTSFNGKPNAPGGWAYVEVVGDPQYFSTHELKSLMSGAALPNPSLPNTSIRMELTAVIQALSSFPESEVIYLLSDSAYVINGLKQKWYTSWFRTGKNSLGKTPANLDLWTELARLASFHRIIPTHIPGHSGYKFQEMADEAAVARTAEAKLHM